MSLKNKLLFFSSCFLFLSCATKEPQKTLSFSEQIAVDSEKAQSLYLYFEKNINFLTKADIEKYLNGIAVRLAHHEKDYEIKKVNVKVHQDSNPTLSRFFSFPGTVISVPKSFLIKVQFENELAAALSFELAKVMKRTLANRVEKTELSAPILFGKGSVFDLESEERAESIELGVKLLYFSGFDTRGMASIFQHYPEYYAPSGDSDLFNKEVAFNIKVAQRVKSDYLPSSKPIVRSDEFIRFKKELR
jgi:predicted Zn-dependent protease